MTEKIFDRLIVFCAFRYALGRMTYVAEHVSSYILDHWYEFNDNDLALFNREIKEAIKNNMAGHKCDIDVWQKIVDKFKNKGGDTNGKT